MDAIEGLFEVSSCRVPEPRKVGAMRVLFVGETWNGSSARSLRDALSHLDGVEIDDVGEDQYRPRGRGLIVRGFNRILMPIYRRELAAEILRRILAFKPDVVIVYKGNLVSEDVVRGVQKLGVRVVNVYPDCSPHTFGTKLRRAMGAYDLVISTKPFHPAHWKSSYDYSNPCVCVPHGFDTNVHLWLEPPASHPVDVVLAASWRPQYESLMVEVGRLMPDSAISVALAGPGWAERHALFPPHWQFPGPLFGRAYGDFVRQGKIVIAPVHSDVEIDGKRQPGDEDTTRTYELAAAWTFFMHRRTPFVATVYEENEEVALWSDAAELVAKIRHYLPREADRARMAAAAHLRAVPAYSVPARAREVLSHIKSLIGDSEASRVA